jgi:hypothetical protein
VAEQDDVAEQDAAPAQDTAAQDTQQDVDTAQVAADDDVRVLRPADRPLVGHRSESAAA